MFILSSIRNPRFAAVLGVVISILASAASPSLASARLRTANGNEGTEVVEGCEGVRTIRHFVADLKKTRASIIALFDVETGEGYRLKPGMASRFSALKKEFKGLLKGASYTDESEPALYELALWAKRTEVLSPKGWGGQNILSQEEFSDLNLSPRDAG